MYPERLDRRQVEHEERIVWVEDPGEYDYVRESVVRSARRRGRLVYPSFKTVGYAELSPSAPSKGRTGRFERRVFWVKPYDRSAMPDGSYSWTAPAEAVDPRTVAPGVPGRLTNRAWGIKPID